MKTKEFKDRLKVVMKHYKVTNEAISFRLGIRPSNITHLLLGRNMPSFELLNRLITEYPDLNPRWLINGSGEMINIEENIKQPSKKVRL